MLLASHLEARFSLIWATRYRQDTHGLGESFGGSWLERRALVALACCHRREIWFRRIRCDVAE